MPVVAVGGVVLSMAGCVRTPPHDPVDGAPVTRTERREQMSHDGDWCSWEAESLYFGERALWAVDTPDDDGGWCETPGESSRMVDVLGQDGPYLSVKLTEMGCCPDHDAVRCFTMDMRTGAAITLEEYDSRRAERRWEQAQKSAVPGLDRGAFVVGDGHVRFCVVHGPDVAFVPVR